MTITGQVILPLNMASKKCIGVYGYSCKTKNKSIDPVSYYVPRISIKRITRMAFRTKMKGNLFGRKITPIVPLFFKCKKKIRGLERDCINDRKNRRKKSTRKK